MKNSEGGEKELAGLLELMRDIAQDPDAGKLKLYRAEPLLDSLVDDPIMQEHWAFQERLRRVQEWELEAKEREMAEGPLVPSPHHERERYEHAVRKAIAKDKKPTDGNVAGELDENADPRTIRRWRARGYIG